MNRYTRQYAAELMVRCSWRYAAVHSPSQCPEASWMNRYFIYYYDKPSLQQIRADMLASIRDDILLQFDSIGGGWMNLDGSRQSDPPC